MNKVIDKGFRSCRFVSTIVKHPVLAATHFAYLFSFYIIVTVVFEYKSL